MFTYAVDHGDEIDAGDFVRDGRLRERACAPDEELLRSDGGEKGLQ